jgi:hypothetical protein
MRIIVTCLMLATMGCGGGSVADEIVHTYSDGSVATIASATDSELRNAAIAMETIHTRTGSYGGGPLIAELESVGEGRLYPSIELRTVDADDATFCVEGGKDGYVKHVRRGGPSPQAGRC